MRGDFGHLPGKLFCPTLGAPGDSNLFTFVLYHIPMEWIFIVDHFFTKNISVDTFCHELALFQDDCPILTIF